MTEQEQILIDELRQNIRRLVEGLEEKTSEVANLKDEVKGLELQLEMFQKEHEDLIKRYENLKVAKALAEGEPGNEVARQKINKIVREIDKCIALLNG
jgi:septation ring formation regulator EzrA